MPKNDDATFIKAISAAMNTKTVIAKELRLMARAESPYERFLNEDEMTINIWNAAAICLEHIPTPSIKSND